MSFFFSEFSQAILLEVDPDLFKQFFPRIIPLEILPEILPEVLQGIVSKVPLGNHSAAYLKFLTEDSEDSLEIPTEAPLAIVSEEPSS